MLKKGRVTMTSFYEERAREWKERHPDMISRFITEDGDVGIIEDDGSVAMMDVSEQEREFFKSQYKKES
jgi:hypothetical protein